jgi:competence protein ComEC
MKKSNLGLLILFLLFVLDGVMWRQIIGAGGVRAGDYFLDVGQGDSELVIFPDGVRVLIDGGPDAKIVAALEKILPFGDRYIDVLINTHPQLDHFEGFSYVLDGFDIGAVATNGRDDSPGVAEWPAFLYKIKAKQIPLITLTRGDSINNGSSSVKILSPDVALSQSAELNDTGIVTIAEMPGLRALFTADIGSNVESYLMTQKNDLRADILKIPHHGSKYSSSDSFLRAVDPRIAVIEVGAHNTYGHPTAQTLARIASSTRAKIFRTDKNGTVAVIIDGRKLKVTTEK